jgi:hypothetical protein
MKYIKLNQYIVSLECVHGILHDYPSDQAIKEGCMPYQRIHVAYNGAPTAILEFKSIDESQIAFNRVAEALGSF